MIDVEPFVMHAAALWTQGDPHVPDGIHLRLVPNPRLGLPAGVVVVERLDISRDTMSGFDDITDRFRGPDGAMLTPGTRLAGQTFTANFGPDDHFIAVWVNVLDAKSKADKQSERIYGYTGDPTQPIRVMAGAEGVLAGNVFWRVEFTGRAGLVERVWAIRQQDPRLEGLFNLCDIWTMPVGGDRNWGTEGGANEYSQPEMEYQKRDGLVDAPLAETPAQAPESSRRREEKRLQQQRDHLLKDLEFLLNAPLTSTIDQLRSEPIIATTRQPGAEPMTTRIQTFPLQTVLGALLEPPLALLMGLGAVHPAASLAPGSVVMYRISSCFVLRRLQDKQADGTLVPDAFFSMFRPEHAITSVQAFYDRDPLLARDSMSMSGEGYEVMQRGRPDLAMVVALRARVAVAIGTRTPLATPQVEAVEDPEYIRTPWPSAWRQDGTRALRLRLTPGTSGMIAMTRDDGSSRTSANELRDSGFRDPIVPAGQAGDSSWIFDNGAPADAFVYRLAARDLFGRWSNWTTIAADAGRRPPPPTPSIKRMPLRVAVPSGTARARSKILLEVNIASKLVAGSLPLTTMVLWLNSIEVYRGPAPTAWPWRTEVDGPELLPAASATVTATVVVHTTAASSPAGNATFVVHDPRPPIPPPFPPPPGWTSFPDAEGLAWIEIDIPTGGHGVRVYHSDERVLRHGMPEHSATSSGQLAARAAELAIPLSAGDKNPANWFELLTDSPLQALPGADRARFRTPVPGGNELLTFLRVAWVGPNLVETPFKESTFLAFKVPPTTPPRRPWVEPKVTWTGPDPEVHLAIHVPHGPVEAKQLRVLKTLNTPRHPLDAKVHSEGSFVPGVKARPEDPSVMSVTDPGERRWTTVWYSVQVADASTAIKPPWSDPSPVVSVRLTPPDPPDSIKARRRVNAQGELVLNIDKPQKDLRVLRVRLVHGAVDNTAVSADPGGVQYDYKTTEIAFDRMIELPTSYDMRVPGSTSKDVLAAFLLDPIGRTTPIQIAET